MNGGLRLGLALALALVACRGTSLRYSGEPGPYDRISEANLQRVAGARAFFERGDLHGARDVLAALAEQLPENVSVGALLQEVEVAAIEREPRARQAELLEELRETYRQRADAAPSVSALVLAARVEPDSPSARRLLERALEIDENCVWGWYGRAHSLVREREFEAAKPLLERALEIEPGHLPSRRLEAGLLARAGDGAQARRAFERWLAAAVGDPRVAASEIDRARVDLAVILALDGRGEEALASLAEAGELSEGERARGYLVEAAAACGVGDPNLALEAARSAAAADPADPLPLLQQGLLLEHWLDDPAGARGAWARMLEVLEEAGSDGDQLAWLQLRIQARLHLERLDLQLAEQSSE